MKLDHWYRVHLAASRNEMHLNLMQPWLDVAKKRLLATDGHILAFVPVDLDKGDKSGAVPVVAAKKARWVRVTALEHRVSFGTKDRGTSYARPKVKFPDVDAVVPKWTPGSPGTLTVYLDPRKLLQLARAIGVQEAEGVALTIKLPKKGSYVDEPMRVRPDHGDVKPADERVLGLLMPRRPPNPKETAKAPQKPAEKPTRRRAK